jgi:hypothetical protein
MRRSSEESALIGRKIDYFELQDYLGTTHSLRDWQSSPSWAPNVRSPSSTPRELAR